MKKLGLLKIDAPIDPRASGSNYLPFDVKVGKAGDYSDTREGRKKMFDKLKEIRSNKNPYQGGLGK